MISMITYVQISMFKFWDLMKTTIILKIFNYFCRCRFKNRLRNFQPENDQKIKNKPGCRKIVVLIRKKKCMKVITTPL